MFFLEIFCLLDCIQKVSSQGELDPSLDNNFTYLLTYNEFIIYKLIGKIIYNIVGKIYKVDLDFNTGLYG
jgi:hypothetical protein